MYVLPDLLQQEVILALEADTTIFPAGYLLKLYTDNSTPDKGTVVGDLTELTNVQVPGYAPIAPSWNGTPIRKGDGSWEDLGSISTFIAAGGPPPAPQIVYGWFMTDAAGTTLIGAGRFDAPFTFVSDGDGISLEPVINFLQVDGTNYTLHLDMEVE